MTVFQSIKLFHYLWLLRFYYSICCMCCLLLLLHPFFMCFVLVGCKLVFSKAWALVNLLRLRLRASPYNMVYDHFCEKSLRWSGTNIYVIYELVSVVWGFIFSGFCFCFPPRAQAKTNWNPSPCGWFLIHSFSEGSVSLQQF